MTKTTNKDINKVAKVRMPKNLFSEEAKLKNEYNDLTLATIKLDMNYNREENHMFKDKKEFKKLKKGWAETMNITTQGLNKQIKKLIEEKFITENGEYFILTNDYGSHFYYDLPRDTMSALIETCQQDIIKIYLFLLGWHKSKEKHNEKFTFSENQLCLVCGLTKTSINREKVALRVAMLEKLGLVKIGAEKVKTTQGQKNFENELLVLEWATDNLKIEDTGIMKARAKAKETKIKKSVAEARPQASDNGFIF